MLSRIKRNFSDVLLLVKRDEKGSIAIESALLLPVFVLILFGSVSLFQVLRVDASYTHAATTLGDLLTRYNDIDDASENELYVAAAGLIPSGGDYKVILTSVVYDDVKKEYQVHWSRDSKDEGGLTNLDLQKYTFPLLAKEESVIMVNVQGAINPFFIDKFVQTINIHKLSVRRPRFVLKIEPKAPTT